MVRVGPDPAWLNRAENSNSKPRGTEEAVSEVEEEEEAEFEVKTKCIGLAGAL